LVAGSGVAAFLSEEAHQADPPLCGFGSGQGDRGRPPDPIENIGLPPLVAGFRSCLARDWQIGVGFPEWMNYAMNFGSYEEGDPDSQDG